MVYISRILFFSSRFPVAGIDPILGKFNARWCTHSVNKNYYAFSTETQIPSWKEYKEKEGEEEKREKK